MRSAFWNFVIEREMVRTKKGAGEKPPFTAIERLRDYWFPNIRRTDDPTWQWWNQFIRPMEDQENLLTATIAFRLFSKIETASKIRPILTRWGWETHAVLQTLGPEENLFNRRLPLGVLPSTLDDACEVMDRVRTMSPLYFLVGGSMENTTMQLEKVRGIGTVLAYEITCDLRHTPWLEICPDARTWAPATPAAVQGASAIIESDLNPDQEAGRAKTLDLMRSLHAEAGDAWGWELSEVHRALSLFGAFVRREPPIRRYRWN